VRQDLGQCASSARDWRQDSDVDARALGRATTAGAEPSSRQRAVGGRVS
jgi:hypothetical protein